MSKFELMRKKLFGMLGSYSVADLTAQIWEKKILDPRRYQKLNGVPPVSERTREVFDQHLVPVKPQTVLIVVHKFFPDSIGGTERFVNSLARELKDIGNRVIICSYSDRDSRSYSCRSGDVIGREEEYQGLEVIRFRLSHPKGSVLKNVQENGGFFQTFFDMLIERFEPGVVHFAHSSRVNGLMHCCKNNGIPYVVTLTDFFLVCHFSTMVDAKGRFCEGSCLGQRCESQCRCLRIRDNEKRYQIAKSFLEGAAAVTAPSCFVAERYEAEFPGVQVYVVPHGIVGEPKVCSRKRIRNFVYVGALTEAKGVSLLIQAFCAMPDECSLMLYGNGSAHALRKLQRLAEGRNNIHFCGSLKQDEVKMAYEAADCIVVPSLVPETYGLVLREALLSGCFAIASRIGALPEVITQDTGILFEPGNCHALEQALEEVTQIERNGRKPNQLPTCRDEAMAYQKLYNEKRV